MAEKKKPIISRNMNQVPVGRGRDLHEVIRELLEIGPGWHLRDSEVAERVTGQARKLTNQRPLPVGDFDVTREFLDLIVSKRLSKGTSRAEDIDRAREIAQSLLETDPKSPHYMSVGEIMQTLGEVGMGAPEIDTSRAGYVGSRISDIDERIKEPIVERLMGRVRDIDREISQSISSGGSTISYGSIVSSSDELRELQKRARQTLRTEVRDARSRGVHSISGVNLRGYAEIQRTIRNRVEAIRESIPEVTGDMDSMRELLEILEVQRDAATSRSEKSIIQSRIAAIRAEYGRRGRAVKERSWELRELSSMIDRLSGSSSRIDDISSSEEALRLLGDYASMYGDSSWSGGLRSHMDRAAKMNETKGYVRDLELAKELGGVVSIRDRSSMDHIGRIVKGSAEALDSEAAEALFMPMGPRGAFSYILDTSDASKFSGIKLPSYLMEPLVDLNLRYAKSGGVYAEARSMKHTEDVLSELYGSTLEFVRGRSRALGMSGDMSTTAEEYATDLILGSIFGSKRNVTVDGITESLGTTHVERVLRFRDGAIRAIDPGEKVSYRSEVGSILRSDDKFSESVARILKDVIPELEDSPRYRRKPFESAVGRMVDFMSGVDTSSARGAVRSEIGRRVRSDRIHEATLGVKEGLGIDDLFGGLVDQSPLPDELIEGASSYTVGSEWISNLRETIEFTSLRNRNIQMSGVSSYDPRRYAENVRNFVKSLDREQVELLSTVDLSKVDMSSLVTTFRSKHAHKRVADGIVESVLRSLRDGATQGETIIDTADIPASVVARISAKSRQGRESLEYISTLRKEVFGGVGDPAARYIGDIEETLPGMSHKLSSEIHSVFEDALARVTEATSKQARLDGLLAGNRMEDSLDILHHLRDSGASVATSDGGIYKVRAVTLAEDYLESSRVHVDLSLHGSLQERVNTLMSMGLTEDEARGMASTNKMFRTTMEWVRNEGGMESVLSDDYVARRASEISESIMDMLPKGAIDDYLTVTNPALGMLDADLSSMTTSEAELVSRSFYNPAERRFYTRGSDRKFAPMDEGDIDALFDIQGRYHPGSVNFMTPDERLMSTVRARIERIRKEGDDIVGSAISSGGRFVPVESEGVPVSSAEFLIKPVRGIGTINQVTEVRASYHDELIRSIFGAADDRARRGRTLFEVGEDGLLGLSREFLPTAIDPRTGMRIHVTPESAGYDMLSSVLLDIQEGLVSRGVDLEVAQMLTEEAGFVPGVKDPAIRRVWSGLDEGVIPSQYRTYTPLSAGNLVRVPVEVFDFDLPGSGSSVSEALDAAGLGVSDIQRSRNVRMSNLLGELIEARAREGGDYEGSLDTLLSAISGHYDRWMHEDVRSKLPPDVQGRIMDMSTRSIGGGGVPPADPTGGMGGQAPQGGTAIEVMEDVAAGASAGYKRMNTGDVMDFLRGNRTVSAGIAAVGGLALYGMYRNRKRRQDVTFEDLQGPRHLPGGSAYERREGLYGVETGMYTEAADMTPDSQTYQVHAMGGSDYKKMQADMSRMVGGSSFTTVNRNRNPIAEARARERAVINGY